MDRGSSRVGYINYKSRMKGGKIWPMQALSAWASRHPSNVKSFLSVLTGITAHAFLCKFVHHRDNLAGAVHLIGICVLIYRLATEKTCAGLSLKSQELTAVYLAVNLYVSFAMLDAAMLATTLWVIYKIRFELRSTYMEDKDNFKIEYVVIPCAVLSLLVHPSTDDHILHRTLVAFCVNLEAVSVLPQLRLMENTKIVEPFTAHYVFSLGVERFLGCAYWVLQVMDPDFLLKDLRSDEWPSMVLLSEIVQTLILAEFCDYYVKNIFGQQLVYRLPSGSGEL